MWLAEETIILLLAFDNWLNNVWCGALPHSCYVCVFHNDAQAAQLYMKKSRWDWMLLIALLQSQQTSYPPYKVGSWEKRMVTCVIFYEKWKVDKRKLKSHKKAYTTFRNFYI